MTHRAHWVPCSANEAWQELKRFLATHPATYRPVLEDFQFETLCVSNHTAWRFAEKNAVFPLTFGRAALYRRLAFHLYQR